MRDDMHNQLEQKLISLRNREDAAFLQRFFKTGEGEYGAGDLFLGLRVPIVRKLAKEYKDMPINEVETLLNSKWHEARTAAVVIMTLQFPKADTKVQRALYDVYIRNIGKGINNWDLVDISCPRIVGAYLYNKDRDPLYDIATGGLWQKRVSIISTFYFLREGDISDTLHLAELLVHEQHDLLQKAVGWALREMGKVDDVVLLSFLDKHAATMPRTMLRYSLEKLTKDKKYHYMTRKDA